jgi:EAL domain-containing protein (putative c-di-GMP-specific phosphodiesterase class I)
MIALSGSLNLVTIAEGIETRKQLAIANKIGFDLAQGFLFSRPRPPSEIPALLTENFNPLEVHAESTSQQDNV